MVRHILCEQWHCDPLRVEFIKHNHPDIFGVEMDVLRIMAQEKKPDDKPNSRGTEPDPNFSNANY